MGVAVSQSNARDDSGEDAILRMRVEVLTPLPLATKLTVAAARTPA
jgi:hypothetical protein